LEKESTAKTLYSRTMGIWRYWKGKR